MKIEAVIFCEGQINLTGPGGGNKPAIINPTYSFRLKYIPSAFSFSVFIMTRGISEKDTEVRIVFQKPGSDVIIMDSSSIIPANIPYIKGLAREIAGLNINAQLTNVTFENEGIYKCSIYVDGVLEKESDLYIDKEPVE